MITCSITECERPIRARGWCNTHWQRWYLLGDVNARVRDRHGRTRTQEYRSWSHAKNRCSNPNYESYMDYGGRGIKMCERWKSSFTNFYADMGPRPSAKHSLDRINIEGDYEPGNCKWSTVEQQANNRRSNIIVTIGAKTQTLTQWARDIGVDSKKVRARFSRGWQPEEALGLIRRSV